MSSQRSTQTLPSSNARVLGAILVRGGELQGDFFTGCDFGDGLVAVNTVGEIATEFF